jgi:NAD(P)-dependent dehydrogenase (short-subunit alcohol dehydrogenase family)
MTLDEWKASRTRGFLGEAEVYVQRKTQELKEAIREARRMLNDKELNDSDPDYEERFTTIFDLGKQVIYPLIRQLRVSFDYYDPDTTYEEDVRAFVDALVEKFGPID